MKKGFWRGLFASWLSTLACQPVVAIGWNEFLVIFLLFVVLLGPLLYRFLRWVEEFLKRRQQNN